MPQKGNDEYDKLYMVRPLVTSVRISFHEAYTPARIMAVDESIVAFKGRTTCAETGFLSNFQVYEGKK